MSLIRTTVAGDPVKLFVLPPRTEKFVDKFRAFVRAESIFGLDVESTAIDEDMGTFDPAMRLRMVQFGDANSAWCFDAEDEFWRPWVVKLLAAKTRKFVSHTNYDILWVLREYGIDLTEGRSLDTLPIAALIRPGERNPKDLKTLASLYIDDGLRNAEQELLARFKELAPKGHRAGNKAPKTWGFTNIPLDDEVFGKYAGLDSVYVRRLLPILRKLADSAGMSALSAREQRIQQISTSVQVRGQLLDREYTKEILEEVEGAYLDTDERLLDALQFSPRSPKLGPWLEERGVIFEPWQRTKTGRPCLNQETLPDIAMRYKDNDDVSAVLADKVALGKNQNILNNLRAIWRSADADGFIHPKINTQAAITGRMSIVQPAMQTFKKRDKRLRGCFIATPGHVFVGADYDSQEIRIAAAFSGDPALLKIIAENLNQHDLTAEMIYGPGYSPVQRDFAKTLDFAQQYGAGPKKIAAQLGVSLEEAIKLWHAWRKAYSRLVRWTDYVAGYSSVENPWGRIIPSDPYRRYANGNYAIQSSGRDVLGDAIIRLDKCGLGKYIWLPIHDEIVLQVPVDIADRAAKALERKMFQEVSGIPLTASAKIVGRRWNGEEPIAA